MKKILFLFLSVSSVLGFLSFTNNGHDKKEYADNSIVIGETKVVVTGAVSTDEILKSKVLIENKNEYFILLNPQKCFYYVNGNKNYTKDREFIIPPNGKKSNVFDLKGPNLDADVLSLVLDGFSKTGNEKMISIPDMKVEPKEKKSAGNIEVVVQDMDYDHNDRLVAKIRVTNIGNDVLILNSAVIELNDNGNTLNNARKRTNSILIRKGESENFGVTFQTTSRKGDRTLVWNDAFVSAAVLPMNPIEIGLSTKPELLSSYNYFLKPEVEKPIVEKSPKKDDVLASNNEAKRSQTQKKEPVKKSEPVKQEQPKRTMEDDVQELHAADISFVDNGAKFYALLIGISDYTDPGIADLDGLPVADAQALEKVLTTQYTFNKENVSVLKNPTRREIVIALDDIAKKATSVDNVLIFYAGHGHYEDDNDIGYWLPKDAELTNSSNWLYNDQLVASMRKIKSLHTLLISDACFSGSIFKNRSIDLSGASDVIKKKYQLPSRKAMTSGTLKTVPNKSVFIKYLLDRLEKNKVKYLSSSALYQSIEQPVGNNSNSLPQFGVIQNVGDEGGDFIFIKK